MKTRNVRNWLNSKYYLLLLLSLNGSVGIVTRPHATQRQTRGSISSWGKRLFRLPNAQTHPVLSNTFFSQGQKGQDE